MARWGPNRPSNIMLLLLRCVALPPIQGSERSWTYGLTRLKHESTLSTILLTSRCLYGKISTTLTIIDLLRYTATALIFAQTNDTGEAVGAWVYNITGSALWVNIIYGACHEPPSTHFRFSGFATTLNSTGVDANTVTFVNMLFNRALSAKFYVTTIIVGMCTILL
jgi:hypothetical protein